MSNAILNDRPCSQVKSSTIIAQFQRGRLRKEIGQSLDSENNAYTTTNGLVKKSTQKYFEQKSFKNMNSCLLLCLILANFIGGFI